MRGTLREKRPGYWELRAYALPDRTGKRRQVSRGFKGNKRDAERALRKLIAEVEAGRHIATEGTVAHVLERWVHHLETLDYSPNTLRGYRNYLRVHIVPALGAKLLHKLRTADLNDLYARMAAAGSSRATVRQCHAILRSGLQFAVDEEWLATNPAVKARAPVLRKSEHTLPTMQQLEELLAAADRYDHEFGVFLRLAAATGARRGELHALRWMDVNTVTGVILIAHSAIDADRVKDTKTHAARRVTVDPGTLELLRRYWKRNEDRAREALLPYPSSGYLFSPDVSGRRHHHPDWATRRFAVVRHQVAGLERMRLHDLRHVHITQLLYAGVPLNLVSARAGHSSGSTTQNIYAHVLPARDHEAAARWGELSKA